MTEPRTFKCYCVPFLPRFWWDLCPEHSVRSQPVEAEKQIVRTLVSDQRPKGSA